MSNKNLYKKSYYFRYGAEEDRTPDPLLAKQVLSQLSYSPRDFAYWQKRVPSAEPLVFGTRENDLIPRNKLNSRMLGTTVFVFQIKFSNKN